MACRYSQLGGSRPVTKGAGVSAVNIWFGVFFVQVDCRVYSLIKTKRFVLASERLEERNLILPDGSRSGQQSNELIADRNLNNEEDLHERG
eukprot:m.50401 g.50401  ORF g.50401 m.50401 type:complete len:91 (+) comp12543_c1_seq1:5708-5980(+)